jgi:hypothetical protein
VLIAMPEHTSSSRFILGKEERGKEVALGHRSFALSNILYFLDMFILMNITLN